MTTSVRQEFYKQEDLLGIAGLELVTAAAFIMEGIHNSGYREFLDYDKGNRQSGAVEKIEAVCQIAAPVFGHMLAFAIVNEIYFDGVFHYEVSSVFGSKYANYCIVNAKPPTEGELAEVIIEVVSSFFLETASKSELKKLLGSLGLSLPIFAEEYYTAQRGG